MVYESIHALIQEIPLIRTSQSARTGEGYCTTTHGYGPADAGSLLLRFHHLPPIYLNGDTELFYLVFVDVWRVDLYLSLAVSLSTLVTLAVVFVGLQEAHGQPTILRGQPYRSMFGGGWTGIPLVFEIKLTVASLELRGSLLRVRLFEIIRRARSDTAHY